MLVNWLSFGIIDAKFFGVIAMFGAILVMALVPWLDTSRVRSGQYRPLFKWWFWLLAVDFVVLMWVGAMPAEGIYPYIALAGSAIGSPISSSSCRCWASSKNPMRCRRPSRKTSMPITGLKPILPSKERQQ